MIEALDPNSRTGFKYLLTGDESLMTYDQSPSRMWAVDRSCADEKVPPANYSQKAKITVFLGVNGIALLDVLPTGAKLASDYFCCNIFEALEQVIYLKGKVLGTTRYTLHFDDARVHNAEKVERRLDECQFRRLEHTPYSQDLAPCDFLLFGYLHNKMQFLSYGTMGELREAITSAVEAIPKTKLIQVFQTCRWRLAMHPVRRKRL
jgi:histone-lysine N-methyltransferase SETMAR